MLYQQTIAELILRFQDREREREEDGREQELTGKAVAKESGPGLEKGGETELKNALKI